MAGEVRQTVIGYFNVTRPQDQGKVLGMWIHDSPKVAKCLDPKKWPRVISHSFASHPFLCHPSLILFPHIFFSPPLFPSVLFHPFHPPFPIWCLHPFLSLYSFISRVLAGYWLVKIYIHIHIPQLLVTSKTYILSGIYCLWREHSWSDGTSLGLWLA